MERRLFILFLNVWISKYALESYATCWEIGSQKITAASQYTWPEI